jgi:anti-sigma B factor antagonist
MFKVEYNQDSQTVKISGNFDTSKAEEVKSVLENINNSVKVDMSELDFISSSGIGIMVMTYQRLKSKGENIYLINLNENIKKVFRVSLLDKVFDIK